MLGRGSEWLSPLRSSPTSPEAFGCWLRHLPHAAAEVAAGTDGKASCHSHAAHEVTQSCEDATSLVIITLHIGLRCSLPGIDCCREITLYAGSHYLTTVDRYVRMTQTCGKPTP